MPLNKDHINDKTEIEGSDELVVRRRIIELRQQRVLANLGKTVKEIEDDGTHKNLSTED